MNGYFINPELKKSSIILIFTIAFFMCVTFFILNLFYLDLKTDYIKTLGAVANRVIEINPALEKDIVPLITKEVSIEEGIKGEKLLLRYGFTKNLENQLFPYFNKIALINNYEIFIIFVLLMTVLFIFNYIQFGFFYKRIRGLTVCAKKVIEGDYDLSIFENAEGDFSKLAVSFNSMREIIKSNIIELYKEKQFLVDLLSDISHQLKTPLSSLMVYNDIMLNNDLSYNQRQYFLKYNQSQLDRMNRLIQSMLKLAKLDAGAIVFEMVNQSLNETIDESIDILKNKAQEGNIKIIFEENEEVIFKHDRLWLEEAFINIIKNSIEHVPTGGKIKVKLLENPVFRRVIIEDNGEGIRQEDLPNIFKRFYKAKTLKKTDSVGIGLALTKSIIESHNGFIEVESKIGVGTIFTITFLKFTT